MLIPLLEILHVTMKHRAKEPGLTNNNNNNKKNVSNPSGAHQRLEPRYFPIRLTSLLSLVFSGVWAYSGLDKKIGLLDQRVNIVSAQIQTYQIERKEDSKRIENKLDNISARIDALIVRGCRNDRGHQCTPGIPGAFCSEDL